MTKLLVLAALSLGWLLASDDYAVEISWQASTSPGVSGYTIWRSQYPHGCTLNPQKDCVKLNQALVPCCEVKDKSVVDGKTYYYWFTASDLTDGLTSVYSGPGEAIIP